MLILLVTFALCLALPIACFNAPDPSATSINRIDLRRAPQPTYRANLLARDGYVKNCGFVNGNLGKFFPLGAIHCISTSGILTLSRRPSTELSPRL
jgi:hypothetical protein